MLTDDKRGLFGPMFLTPEALLLGRLGLASDVLPHLHEGPLVHLVSRTVQRVQHLRKLKHRRVLNWLHNLFRTLQLETRTVECLVILYVLVHLVLRYHQWDVLHWLFYFVHRLYINQIIPIFFYWLFDFM